MPTPFGRTRPLPMSTLSDALDAHLSALTSVGAVSPQVLLPADAEHVAALEHLRRVTLPEAFRDYLARVGGYDRAQGRALDAFEPDFAWGLFALDASAIPTHYRHAGILTADPDEYWPFGFLPFLWGGSGDYAVIDCRAASPTYGAVFDLDEAHGVGTEPLAPDLAAFLRAATAELTDGRRVFRSPTVSRLAVQWGRDG